MDKKILNESKKRLVINYKLNPILKKLLKKVFLETRIFTKDLYILFYKKVIQDRFMLVKGCE